jgi:ABC-type nitrate/sulfonate/bicarbonate transport system permease component
MTGGWIRRLIALAVIAALLALWEMASRLGYLAPYKFPAPSRIAAAAVEMSRMGFPSGVTIWSHAGITLGRIVQGYLAAIVLAVPVGLVIGGFPVLDRMLAPLVVFCRSIATLSLLPLAIVWFGAGEAVKVFLIAYGCFWVMLSNVIVGVRYVDPVLICAGRSLGMSGAELYRRVVLPAALPRFFAGARMALGVGFMVIVGAEMIGTIKGLGALIMEARTFYRSDITILGMLVIGVFGLAISTGLAGLERRLLPWAAEDRR